MPLGELWTRWGDELPLWEVAIDLDPPVEKWIANAAWQLAFALVRREGTIREADFYAAEKPAAQTHQASEEQIAAAAAKIHQQAAKIQAKKEEREIVRTERA